MLIDTLGNINASNTITASNFVGSGSGITNLDYNYISLNKPTNFQSDWTTTIINKPSNFQSDWNSTIINKPTNFQSCNDSTCRSLYYALLCIVNRKFITK